MIQWEDFEKIDIRIGTIIHVAKNEKANKPAYILSIDFGALGILKSSAQITKLYDANTLINKQVAAVVNFPPKQIAQTISSCLVLGTLGENNEITLLTPDKLVANGIKVG